MSKTLLTALAAALLAAGSTIALAQTGENPRGTPSPGQSNEQPKASPPPGAMTPSARPDHPDPPAAAVLPGAVPSTGLQEDPAIIRRNPQLPGRAAPASTDVGPE